MVARALVVRMSLGLAIFSIPFLLQPGSGAVAHDMIAPGVIAYITEHNTVDPCWALLVVGIVFFVEEDGNLSSVITSLGETF